MDFFWGISKKEKKTGEIKELLRGIPLFEQLTDRQLAVVERILHERLYTPGEEIFREGEPGVAVYFIQSGSVLIKLGRDKKVLAELHEGEFFGELALLDDSPRSASAIAGSESKIFAFSQPDLFAMIDRNPRLGIQIVLSLARIIGDRLKRINEQVLGLAKERV